MMDGWISAFVGLMILVVAYRAVKIYLRLGELWATATQDRREEYLRLFMFFRRWHMDTGVRISRAYLPFIDETFGWTSYGFICKAVVIVPIFMEGDMELVPVCTRSASRRKCWIFDIGATGMCSADLSVYENAKNELYEELGLKSDVVLDKVLMPYEGYGSIVYVYKVVLPSSRTPPELKSTDGTFEKITWIANNRDAIVKYARQEVYDNLDLAACTSQLFTRNMSKILISNLKV